MIEHWIHNELSLKRYRRFKSKKSAIVALWILLTSLFFSFTAEFWANNKPLLLKYNGKLYFPIVTNYHPSAFGIENAVTMNYKSLKLEGENFAIWTILKQNPYESNLSVESFPSPPSKENLFGTDDRGRDVAARLLYGFRYSITYAIFVFLLSYLIGIFIGSIMGYFGGWLDLLGQRFLEVWESMPVFMLLLTLITIFQPNLVLFICISSLFGWMAISVYMRAEFLKLRKREFVEAGRSLGISQFRVIFIHVLPNALGPAITFAPFVVASGISSLAALDYLGFGLIPPTPSWGELLAQAKNNFTIAWWLAAFPSLALFITLMSLSLIGDALRDAIDPRLH